MRFFRGDKRERKVVWSFVPDDRETIPFAHSFGSRIYDREEELQEDIGERFKPTPWRGGQPPCPEPSAGLCGTEEQWQLGVGPSDPLPKCWPGTNVGTCCDMQSFTACGGIAIGDAHPRCHMDSTCDIYRPWGAPFPLTTNVACSFVNDLPVGRNTNFGLSLSWTHYMDVDSAVDIMDGCNRTVSLDSINYADGDQVIIPSGGTGVYVVVWVTLCDSDSGTVKRVYLLRHAF